MKVLKRALGFILTIMIAVSALTGQALAADIKKADVSAISGFANSYTSDDKGNFEINGAMVAAGQVYNITVDDGAIQAWCGKNKSFKWKDKALTDLLNQPTTVFYERVSGTKDSAEFSSKVEFTRPNGKSF